MMLDYESFVSETWRERKARREDMTRGASEVAFNPITDSTSKSSTLAFHAVAEAGLPAPSMYRQCVCVCVCAGVAVMFHKYAFVEVT